MPGGPPTPGLLSDPISITGLGSGFCFQFSEFNPLGAVSFTRTGVGNIDCVVPGAISCGFFIDTTPGGEVSGPINGGLRLDNYESYASDCGGGAMTFRYDNGIFSQLGITSLFLRAWSSDNCGTSYTGSVPIGPFNPVTHTDVDIVTNTGLPTGFVISLDSHDDDTGGELPIGIYKVLFEIVDDVTDEGLDLDNVGLTYEIWTKPMRGGKFLMGGGGFASRQAIHTPLIVDSELQDLFNQIAKDASGTTRCLTRYIHAYNGGCNETDIAQYDVCITPFKNDVNGEHLVHVVCSTNHEESVFPGPGPDYVPAFAEQDLKDQVNLFFPATAYRPGEANGFWTWVPPLGPGIRAPGTNADDDDNPSEDVGPPDPVTGIRPPENEPVFNHWVNIQIETDPLQGKSAPGVQAQATLGLEILAGDLSVHCS